MSLKEAASRPSPNVSRTKQSCNKISLPRGAGMGQAGSYWKGAAMVTDHVETLIVGAGQAGLAMSHVLSRRGRPHLVLERGRLGERWRSERWDGLRFQFPNWSVRLPDFPFPCSEPDGFATSTEIVRFLEAYADLVRPPMRCGVAVTGLHRVEPDKGFRAQTSTGLVSAGNVVIATGPSCGRG